jgi:hypothetical protein
MTDKLAQTHGKKTDSVRNSAERESEAQRFRYIQNVGAWIFFQLKKNAFYSDVF